MELSGVKAGIRNTIPVLFYSVEEEESVFGGCSCGVPKMHGIPCHHMVAVVKSHCIEGLNPVNAMLPWWMTAHWRKQYPQGTEVNWDVDIQTLRNASGDTTFKNCPPYTAPNKAGGPKKNKWQKSSLEVASEKYIKKQEKKRTQEYTNIKSTDVKRKKRGKDGEVRDKVREKGDEGGANWRLKKRRSNDGVVERREMRVA